MAKETTSVNPLQLQKVSPPMLSNPLPRVSVSVNPLQLRNALEKMEQEIADFAGRVQLVALHVEHLTGKHVREK